MDVRRGRSEFVLVTDLVVHHNIADIFDQAVQFIRILDVAEETLDLPLFCQLFEFSENVFQSPDDPCLSDSTLDLGGSGLTVPAAFSCLAP